MTAHPERSPITLIASLRDQVEVMTIYTEHVDAAYAEGMKKRPCESLEETLFLHYLNLVPVREIYERCIRKFEC